MIPFHYFTSWRVDFLRVDRYKIPRPTFKTGLFLRINAHTWPLFFQAKGFLAPSTLEPLA